LEGDENMVETEQESLKEMESKICDVLEKKINPELLEHHGWVDIESIKANKVYVRFRGACSSCMSTYDTFNKKVKPELMKAVKEIEDVIIADEVSNELIDFAQSLFTKRNK
jgi:Fe-S cluster biogenesis protein NfuA